MGAFDQIERFYPDAGPRRMVYVSKNVLLHFVGILSLDIQASKHTKAPVFIPTSHSTSHLSALYWVAQIFMLEYALPSQAYSINAWPSRDSYSPHALAQL